MFAGVPSSNWSRFGITTAILYLKKQNPYSSAKNANFKQQNNTKLKKQTLITHP